jgi:hypothetical protein
LFRSWCFLNLPDRRGRKWRGSVSNSGAHSAAISVSSVGSQLHPLHYWRKCHLLYGSGVCLITIQFHSGDFSRNEVLFTEYVWVNACCSKSWHTFCTGITSDSLLWGDLRGPERETLAFARCVRWDRNHKVIILARALF